MGVGTANTPGQNESSLASTYAELLPTISSATNQQLTPTAQANLQAEQATNPGYLQQQQQFSLPTAQVNQQVAASNAQAGAASNLNLLNGAGGQAATAGQALNESLNPNYYNTLNAASKGAQSALGAINLNGLSPGESNAIERSLNQNNTSTGNLGLLNPTNTIVNAMNFGGAFNSKLGLMNNAVSSATGVANTASGNAGYSPTGTALSTGQTAQGNPFSNSTNAGTSNSANNVFNTAALGNLMTTANIQNEQQNKLDYAGSTQGIAGSFGSGNGLSGGSGCCFIFLETYNGILPAHVRECRDYFYKQKPTVAKGYKRMAKYLVPLMKKSNTISKLINKFMVKPISEYGAWLTNKSNNGKEQYSYKRFWFSIWYIIGAF